MGNQLWIEDDEKFDGNHPGCMSGILNALVDYHQWHSSVKKMLPYRKQDVRHRKCDRNPKIRLIKNDSFEVQKLLDAETNQHHVDQRTRKASSTNKRSLRARIRALVSEQGDDQKRQAPGVRAGSRLQRTYSIHHLEPSSDWGHPIIFLPKTVDTGASKLTDYNQLAVNHTAQEEKFEKLIETSVSEELVQETKLRQNASDHQVTEYVDVLEIFEVNKDLFQNILQNTDGQQSSNTKARLTKSGSFPAAYSSCGKNFRPAKLKHKQTESYSFPKGEKLVSDARAPKLVSSKSEPLMTDGSANDLNKGTFSHISRISSLRESMDRYAQLFENSSNRLPKLNMSKSLRLTNENEILSSSHASIFFRRILSFPYLGNSGSIHNQESHVDKGPVALPGITEKYIGLDYEEGPDYVNSIVERNEISPRAEYSACSMVGMNDMDSPEVDVLSEILSGFTVGRSNYQKEKEETPTEVQPSAVLVPESCFQEEVKIHAEFHDTEGPDFRCNSFYKNESEINSLHISDAEILLQSCQNEHPEKFEIAKQPVKNHRHIKSCMEDDADFIYVRDILEQSGFITNGFQETWYSSDHPLDPSLFEEIEYRYSHEPECLEQEITALSHHLLLFDLVDEVLFDMFERSYTYYPKVLSSACHVRPVPTGHHFLDEVWGNISKSLSFKPETKQSLDLDFAVTQDLGKDDGWMNLQFDSESLALGLEDLLLDELLGEIFCS